MNNNDIPIYFQENRVSIDVEYQELENNLMSIVSPGEAITKDPLFMRGHGTFYENGTLYSSNAGVIHRVNKLISVQTLKSRYQGEIGDLIIGRITQVSQKRWKVDTNSKMSSVLLLSSINLPGGILRRKSESDELQMRNFFVEGDLLSAEVQTIYPDGSLSIHTRNLKYGKLKNGMFLSVPSSLIKRSKSHFHILPCGLKVILGLNGYIWIYKANSEVEEDSELLYVSKNDYIEDRDRENMSRLRKCILSLAENFMYIDESSMNFSFEYSLSFSLQSLRFPDTMKRIAEETKKQLFMMTDSSN